MIELTETQTIFLTGGAQRPDNIAMPLPKGLVGAAAKMAVNKLIEPRWHQDVDANLRQGEPLRRKAGNGHGTTLVVTDAGLLAIRIEPVVIKTMTAIHENAAGVPTQGSDAARRDQAGHPDQYAAGAGWRDDHRHRRCPI